MYKVTTDWTDVNGVIFSDVRFADERDETRAVNAVRDHVPHIAQVHGDKLCNAKVTFEKVDAAPEGVDVLKMKPRASTRDFKLY